MARHGDRLRGAQMDRRVADPAVAPAAHGADPAQHQGDTRPRPRDRPVQGGNRGQDDRSEEHTSELQSLMRISYAVFCLKKKKKQYNTEPAANKKKEIKENQ